MRDLASFALGVGLLVWAIIWRNPPPDPLSVAIGAALVGLPSASMLIGRRDAEK